MLHAQKERIKIVDESRDRKKSLAKNVCERPAGREQDEKLLGSITNARRHLTARASPIKRQNSYSDRQEVEFSSPIFSWHLASNNAIDP